MRIDGSTVFNEVGLNNNVRMESEDDPAMFNLNASLNRIGIGEGSPLAGLLHLSRVNDQTNPILVLERGDGGQTWGFHENGNRLIIRDMSNSLDVMTFENAGTGLVGIGRVPVSRQLEVQGDLFVDGDGFKSAPGTLWTVTSDRRLKTDIFGLTNALDRIRQLRPVRYRYSPQYVADNPGVEDRIYYNYIAQEFREVFPNHVMEGANGFLRVDASPTLPFLVKGMQELLDVVERQEGAISALRAEIAALRARESTGNGTAILTSQQSQIDKLTALVNRLLEQRRVAEDNNENDDGSDDNDQNQQ